MFGSRKIGEFGKSSVIRQIKQFLLGNLPNINSAKHSASYMITVSSSVYLRLGVYMSSAFLQINTVN